MSDYEMVSELVSKTGASFEEAKAAYESCGRNMLDAVILLEKNRKNAGCFSFKSKRAKREKNEKSAGDFSFEAKKVKSAKDGIKNFFAKLVSLAGDAFIFLCSNNVRVSGEREYFSVPLIMALIAVLVMSGILIPVIVISLFFGVSYTFTGSDIKEDIFLGFTHRGGADNGFFGK